MVALLALTGCGGDNDGGGTPSRRATSATAKPSGGGTTLRVTANPGGALRFDKRRLAAKAGTVAIVVSNPSSVDHSIAVQGQGIKREGQTVGQGGTARVFADLKPGRYEFYCPVDGHEEVGMKGTLSVK
jgi:plastocyanin